MNHLVAANSQPPLPLAQILLKSLAALLLAVYCLAGSVFAAGTNSVSLAWDRNPETNIAGYRLQYGLTEGSFPGVIDAGNTTSATVTGLNQGTTYYFTVVAYNTAGQTSAASSVVTYTVPGAPNTAPTADSFSLTVGEDDQTAATASGSDVDGDTLTYSIVSSPTKGSLTGTAPNWTYKPAANANGSDSFTYRTNDGVLNSENATVSITITPVNDAPVADAKSLSVQEDGTLAITLSGSDVDGDPLTYTIVSSPSKGTLIGTAPNLTYTPGANLNGSDSFTYRVNDGTTNSATATVSITISSVNDIPVANAQTLTTAEDTPLGITLSGSDVESTSLTYSITTAPTKGTLSGTAPNLTYTPTANFNGSDSFAFRVNDGSANSPTATVSITVTPVNDAPVATPRILATTPNTALAITLAGTDVEGSPLTYAIVTYPASGTLSGTAPNLTYTPNSGFLGADSFTYRVNDGTLDSALATVSITVSPANVAPIANAQSVTVAEDGQLPITLTGSDPEGGPITYTVLSQPTKGTLTGTAPNLTYKPSANYNGSDSLTFRVNDGSLNSTTATISITVTAVNDAPVATSRTYSTMSGTALAVTLAGSDVEGSALQYSVVSFPSNGTLSGTAPNLTYTSSAYFDGADSFTYRVNDGSLNSAVATVTIAVTASNRVPQAHGKSATTMKGKAVTVTLSGSDDDADALSFRIVNGPVDGTLSGTPPNVTYTPVAKWTGNDKFTYVANDGKTDSPVATVDLKVKATNKKPVATPGSATVNQNAAGSITLAGTDPDGDNLTFSVVKKPANGTIVGTSPNLAYVPKSGFKGKDTFTFVANDGTANSAPAVMTVTVVNLNNRAPSATALNLTGPAKVVVPVTLGGSDPDGDALTFRIVSKPAIGKLTGTGKNFKYKPTATFSGVVTFSYVVNDGSVDSAPVQVVITIAPPVPKVRSIAEKSKDDLQIAPASAVSGATNRVIFTLVGPPAQRCMLQYSTDLTSWTDLQEVDLPTTGTYTFEVNPTQELPRGFFRLEYPD